MNLPGQQVPARAWVVTFAGAAVNLCLGILYAWSVWKSNLVASKDNAPGDPMSGLNAGWEYLTDAQGTWAYAICGFTFALFMIPGGRIQDRFGPKVGATAGGLFLAAGCIVAGLLKSYVGLIAGFGLLGGIGMGLGYAAATPAAVKWFSAQKRGLVVGLVVGGYGGAAIYIAPLARYLIATYGLSGSFIGLGVFFAVVIVAAAQLMSWPPAGYVAPMAAVATTSASTKRQAGMTRYDWSAAEMLKTWQFYALVFMFIGSAQSGLLVIANAVTLLKETTPSAESYAWMLASYGGLVNALGRIGTGLYSDAIGRRNAYLINGLVSAVCLLVTPYIVRSGNLPLLFLVVGIAYWQYGGGLSLLPAYTADFFGSKNLGFNYGLVFIGWGIAFFVPQIAGYIKDATGSRDYAFYLSAGLLAAAILLACVVRRPMHKAETVT